MKQPDFSDAIANKKLFAPYFGGASWATMTAVLKAAFAEPLTAEQLAKFKAVAGREPPMQRVRELAIIAGRGAGKDSAASLIAAYVAMTFDPRNKLRPGEVATILNCACDREQAKIAFSYTRGLFEQVPALAAMVTRVTADTIELSNRVVIEVGTNSHRSTRGRSFLLAIFDEASFFRSDDNFASTDTELHAAISPGLARVPGSMLVMISTAHKRSGLLYERWKKFYGKDDDDVLVVRGGTRDFNPTFDQRVIDKALADDAALYRAEYLSEWRDDLSTLISRELLDAAVDSGVIVRPPQKGIQYKSFCDPSGGSADSFTMAICHSENDTAVLDCLLEIKPPFNPDTATLQIASTLKSYGISSTVSDRYAAQWVVAAFDRNDIKLEHSERDRSAIYLDALPLFNSGRVRLLDNPRLVSQFAQLERRTFSTGKDRVDHGRNGHDDLCNSAAGAMVLATEKGGYLSDLSWVGGPACEPDKPHPAPSLWDHPVFRYW